MKQQILLSEPATTIVLTSSNTAYATLTESKQLYRLQLPNIDDEKVVINRDDRCTIMNVCNLDS